MDFQEPYCPSGLFWRVKEGDTLFLIATEVGTTVAELLRLNPGIDPGNLRSGQSICLPAELPPCPSGIFWKVAAGDTLFTIAQATGTTAEAILASNPGIDPNNLQPGQNLCLPSEVYPCASGVTWEVAAGDTLFTIAKATGTTVEQLLEANPGVDPANLQVGQKICIP